MTSTSIHACVRMSGRFLRLQIILPYSSLIFHDGDNLLITYHKQTCMKSPVVKFSRETKKRISGSGGVIGLFLRKFSLAFGVQWNYFFLLIIVLEGLDYSGII